MSLKSCVECGRKVSSKARRCPQCDRPDPTRGELEPTRNSLLVSPSRLRQLRARCRECGQAVSFAGSACSSCGCPHATEPTGRRWAAVAVMGLILAMVVVTAWKLGLLDSQTPTRPGIESGLQRSEEHTSELQSPCNLVCRLL